MVWQLQLWALSEGEWEGSNGAVDKGGTECGVFERA